MFKFLTWLLGGGKSQVYGANGNLIKGTTSEMNEGNYHSGPLGYSANTSYPDTQYGSMFDSDQEDEEDEWHDR